MLGSCTRCKSCFSHSCIHEAYAQSLCLQALGLQAMCLRDFQHLCQKINELHQQNDESGKCRSKDHVHSNLQQSHGFGEFAAFSSRTTFATPKNICLLLCRECSGSRNAEQLPLHSQPGSEAWPGLSKLPIEPCRPSFCALPG